MGDYANDIRRGEGRGHVKYPKAIDGIVRQNCRRVVATSTEFTFQADELDGVLIVNIPTEVPAITGVVYLPLLTTCKPDQEIRVCVVGAAGTTCNVLVYNGSADLINEDTPAGAIAIEIPTGHTSASRKFQRYQSNALDSWYLVCCLQEEVEL